jgi:hypothetical protein
MKCVVTVGAGFIGAQMYKELLDLGKVMRPDNFDLQNSSSNEYGLYNANV